MKIESKRQKAFGSTALTLLLSALVLGSSFLAAALLEYTIPRETDETVELGDICEPVVYPGGILKSSLYPWERNDPEQSRTPDDKEREMLSWIPFFLSELMETSFAPDVFNNAFVAVDRPAMMDNKITYYFVNEEVVTDIADRRYTVNLAVEPYGSLSYFTCLPEETASSEHFRRAYAALEELIRVCNGDIHEIPGTFESNQISTQQWTFVNSFQCMRDRTSFPLFLFQDLLSAKTDAEVLMTDSELMVLCPTWQTNVLFIDPASCRIIGFGTTGG